MSIVDKSQSGRACAEPASRPSAPRIGGGAKRRALTSVSTRARCWLDDAASDHNILRSTPSPSFCQFLALGNTWRRERPCVASEGHVGIAVRIEVQEHDSWKEQRTRKRSRTDPRILVPPRTHLGDRDTDILAEDQPSRRAADGGVQRPAANASRCHRRARRPNNGRPNGHRKMRPERRTRDTAVCLPSRPSATYPSMPRSPGPSGLDRCRTPHRQHRVRLRGERLLYRVEQHRSTHPGRSRSLAGPSPLATGAPRPPSPARSSRSSERPDPEDALGDRLNPAAATEGGGPAWY